MAGSPPPSGIGPGRVYTDGSRLFAEYKYDNLVARQGWAFAILGPDGCVMAAASGSTPWWAEGIHAAELWALVNATQVAFPGSSFFVDCKAVQVGAKNGVQWAKSPCRRFGRAWTSIAHVVEQYPDCITWMPAHCNSSAVGIARLSSGEALTRDDLWANAYVDGLAKDVAKKIAPSRKIRDHITKTSQLIEDVARWIGQITVLANHYTFHNQDGTKSIIRDSDGKRCKPRFVKPVLARGGKKRKRELASPNSLDSMMETPSFSTCTALADAGRKLPATCIVYS